jgi:hypothetical protein
LRWRALIARAATSERKTGICSANAGTGDPDPSIALFLHQRPCRAGYQTAHHGVRNSHYSGLTRPRVSGTSRPPMR